MIIYKTTNLVNGKIYVGKHLNDDETYLGSGTLFKRALRKYGRDNFVRVIIEHCDSQEQLDAREQFWIKELNALHPNGYNIAEGGEGGDTFTSHPRRELIREKMRARSLGEKNVMFGKKHTEESLKKMRENRKGKRLGVPTWNKGLSWEEIKKHYTRFGWGPTRTATSPNGETYNVVSLRVFCKEHDLSYPSAITFVDSGVIPPPNRPSSKARNNLTGWSIRRNVDSN